MNARRPHATPRAPRGPFSRRINVHDVPVKGLEMAINATSDECAAIAADVGIPAVNRLSARYHIAHRTGDHLAVSGMLEASITQVCVVSIEPFESEVKRPIELTFAPRATPPRITGHHGDRHREDRHRESLPTAPIAMPGDDLDDPPDPIVDDTIDLGSVALEFLVLSLDLYPRKPGVHFADVVIGEEDDAKPSAFAALARLKDRS